MNQSGSVLMPTLKLRRKIPHLISHTNIYNRISWNNLNEKYDVYTKDIYSLTPSSNPDILSGWRFPGRFLLYDSWHRGLAHAHNWNTLQRYGDHFVMLGAANTFQPHGLHYMWDQGRIHYTSDTIWFQPSAHIDEIMMQTWKPNVVKAISSVDNTLDVTAKINDAKDELTIYVANLSNEPREAILHIDNFKFKSKADIITIGDCDLTKYNTYNNMNNVVPDRRQVTYSRQDAKYIFPRYSHTVITLKK